MHSTTFSRGEFLLLINACLTYFDKMSGVPEINSCIYEILTRISNRITKFSLQVGMLYVTIITSIFRKIFNFSKKEGDCFQATVGF